ncbi:MAG: acetyl-CoA C-acetyltransferase [Gammaproteobacteria bacterium]|nr:acetyl-CoA C-acetyltransferase [Gammaproteobacteria bacterium]
MSGKPVYVVDGLRSPILKARGRPGPFTAADMSLAVARSLLSKHSQSAENIDEIILGCVMPRADEANIARLVGLRLDLPDSIPAWTVQRNCASGMQALDSAMGQIRLGNSNLVLAGGVEAMSHAPLLFKEQYVHWLADLAKAKSVKSKLKVIAKFRPGLLKPIIGLLCGLTDPTVNMSMGQTAEKIAYRFNISREEMDEYAIRSHLRLAKAQQDNLFKQEIEPLYDKHGKLHEYDDGVRPDSSMEKLAKLRAVFDKPNGKITAGNSAQISDGAAWLMLASEKALKQFDLSPIAKLTSCHWAGLDPSEMGLGPVHATNLLLKKNKLALDDIDFWELNEAFAGQVLACLAAFNDADYCKQQFNSRKAWGLIDQEKLNVHGGAVASGHPVGMTGARIVLHMIHILKQNNAHKGIATLCIGGGQGGAMLVETVQ